MRIAALYDIHANLPALEAVLRDVRQAEVDSVVVGGDVLLGPMPHETLACLHSFDMPVRFIYGNVEVAVLEQMAGKDPVAVREQHRPLVRWTAQQLHPEDEQMLASWPKTLRVEIPEIGEILFCHATPRNENEIFTSLTLEERLRPIFEGLHVSLVVCGHTHMQFDRMIGDVRVVNAGSVGMPFGEPGAYWLLLGPNIQLRRTLYDFTEAAERIRNTAYPQAQEFAARNVLQTPSKQEMLEVFTRADLTA